MSRFSLFEFAESNPKKILKIIKTFFLIIVLLGGVKEVNAQVVINEVGVAPASGNSGLDVGNGGEFIELFNQGTTCVDISCWVIMSAATSGGSNPTGWTITIPSGKKIRPGQCFLIGGGGLSATPSTAWNNSAVGGSSWVNTFGASGSNTADLEVKSTYNSSFNSINPGNYNNNRGQVNLLDQNHNLIYSIAWSNIATIDNNTGSYSGCKSNSTSGCSITTISTQPNSTNFLFNTTINNGGGKAGIYLTSTGWQSSTTLTPGKPNPSPVSSGTVPTPTFNFSNSICLTSAPASLPSTSNEGYAGTWSPVSINTTATTVQTYTFTPNPALCINPFILTITPAPSTGTLSGTQAICSNNITTSFSSTISGGTWSSSNTAVATINSSSGSISPVSAGTAIMTYTVTGTGGCSNATGTRTLTVTAPPSAGTINGSTPLCSSVTPLPQFTSTGTAGGAWTSSVITVATINASTGVVTPVSAGTTIITYLVTGTGGCSNVSNTKSITISPSPSAGISLSGANPSPAPPNTICSGSSATLTSCTKYNTALSSTSSTSILDGAAVSASPDISTAGWAQNNINVAGFCSSTFQSWQSLIVKINITHSNVNNLKIYLRSPNNTVVRLVNNGVTSGANYTNTTFSSTGSSILTAGAPYSGNYAPSQPFSGFIGSVINGGWTLFVGDGTPTNTGIINNWSITFTDPTIYTYTWSPSTFLSTNNTYSTTLTPVLAIAVTLPYTLTVSNGTCSATSSVSINVQPVLPNAGNLTGNSTLCQNTTTAFSSDISGGTWSSSNTSFLTVDPTTGITTGIAPGSANLIYTLPGSSGCSGATSTQAITVVPAPNAGTISGSQTICANESVDYTSTGSGGIWTSSNSDVATIDAAGHIIANQSGNTTISYTVNGTGACSTSTDVATLVLTVNDKPSVSVTTSSTCIGGSAIVTANPADAANYTYNWTVPSGVADPGDIDHFSTTVQGQYSVTITNTATGCTSNQAIGTVTFNSTPNAGALNGSTSLCLNSTGAGLTPTVSGGVFSSSNTGVATVSSTGDITPIAPGSTTITYTIGSGACSGSIPKIITITAPPVAGTISGPQNICSNATTTFVSTGASSLGNWSSGNETIATINAAGVITPSSTDANGTVTMSYTVAGTGGCDDAVETRDVIITAMPNAGLLSGDQTICDNAITTFISTGASDLGIWTSNNTAVATINPTTGAITAVSAGTATMTFTVTGSGGCADVSSTRAVTVTAAPNAGTINGTTAICSNGSSTLTSTATGGSWATNNTSVATVNSTTGLVTAVSTGTATITYTVIGTGGCANASSTTDVTITSAPNAGTISGTTAICSNGSTTLNTSGTGGSWSSNNTSVATINSITGGVTAISSGTAIMTYSIVGTGGCSNATANSTIIVTAAPNAGTISGATTVCSNGTSTLSTTGSGGTWSSSNSNVATINTSTGLITPVAAGVTTLSYTVIGTGGCNNATSTFDVSIIALPIASITNNSGSNVLTCAQSSINLSASGGGTYLWNNSLGNADAVTITNPGNYAVTVTVTGGCTSTAAINITQNITPPTASITNGSGTTILTCAQPSINLTANGNGSFSWNNGLGSSPAVTIGSAGTYILTVTGSNGCTSTAQVAITASSSIPTATITNLTGSTELNCVRNSISVTASGGSSYSWNNGLGNNANATITQPGTYTVTVTGTNGCSATSQITITRDITAPVASIDNSSNTTELTCTQTTIDVTASGGGTYSWNNGLGSSDIVSITNPGNYIVTVTGTNGCSSTASINITRNITPPTANITNNSGTTSLTCTQSSISVTATGGSSYNWSNGLGSTPTVSIGAPGTFTVTVIGLNGCTSTAQINVTSSSSLPSPVINNITGSTELNCVRNSINLTASGGVSYLWSPGLINNANISITQPGIYTVTATGSNGCTSSSQIVITQDINLPTASITNNSGTTVLTCTQPTINLSANGGNGYSWNNGLGNVQTVNIGTAGTFVVTVTGANGCSSTAQTVVTASADLPVVSITNNTGQTILDCNTTSVNVTASGGTSYSWTNGLGNNADANISMPGSYTVTVTSSNGCSATSQINITQDIVLPDAQIINNTNSTVLNCTNTSISLSAIGGLTYSWNQSLGTAPDVSITSSGNYQVTVTGNNGCSSLAQVDITQGQIGGVSSSFVASSCGSYSLPWGEVASASGDYTHSYTTTQGCDSLVTATITISPGGVTSSFDATSCSNYTLPWGVVVSSSGAYTHAYATTQGCDSIVTANITIDSPVEPLFNPVSICIGTNYQLPTVSNNGITGSWTPAFDNTTSGPYQFTPDAGQCASSTTLFVVVNSNDPQPLFTPVYSICYGSNLVLPTVSNNGISGDWTPAINNTTTTTYTFTPSSGQCPVNAAMTITVNPLPQGNFTSSQQQICQGDSVQLLASLANAYQWYFNGNPIPGAIANHYFATQEGSYTVEFVSDSGCKVMATDVASLSLTQKPEVIFNALSTCPQKPLQFSSESIIASSLPVSYWWNFGNGQTANQPQASTVYATGGNYNVTLTVTPDACPQLADSVTRSVFIYEPRAGVRYNPIDAVIHEPVNLAARTFGTAYLWVPSTGLNSDVIRNPLLDPTREITYTIQISDLNGCETVDTQFVRIHKNTDIQVPQVFTPNGDGNNDLLYPFLIGVKSLKYFRVYNRWGNLLFETNEWNASKGWNGSFRGKAQPSETYIWVAEGIDVEGKPIKRGGNILLVR